MQTISSLIGSAKSLALAATLATVAVSAVAQTLLHEITGQRPRWFRAVVGMANPFVSAPL